MFFYMDDNAQGQYEVNWDILSQPISWNKRCMVTTASTTPVIASQCNLYLHSMFSNMQIIRCTLNSLPKCSINFAITAWRNEIYVNICPFFKIQSVWKTYKTPICNNCIACFILCQHTFVSYLYFVPAQFTKRKFG